MIAYKIPNAFGIKTYKSNQITTYNNNNARRKSRIGEEVRKLTEPRVISVIILIFVGLTMSLLSFDNDFLVYAKSSTKNSDVAAADTDHSDKQGEGANGQQTSNHNGKTKTSSGGTLTEPNTAQIQNPRFTPQQQDQASSMGNEKAKATPDSPSMKSKSLLDSKFDNNDDNDVVKDRQLSKEHFGTLVISQDHNNNNPFLDKLITPSQSLLISSLSSFTVFVTADNGTSSVIPLPVNETNSSDIAIDKTTTHVLSLSDNSKYKVAEDSVDNDHTAIATIMSTDCSGIIKAGETKRCVISSK
jgi:hypothetical protein